jgi:hypothetical protein
MVPLKENGPLDEVEVEEEVEVVVELFPEFPKPNPKKDPINPDGVDVSNPDRFACKQEKNIKI